MSQSSLQGWMDEWVGGVGPPHVGIDIDMVGKVRHLTKSDVFLSPIWTLVTRGLGATLWLPCRSLGCFEGHIVPVASRQSTLGTPDTRQHCQHQQTPFDTVNIKSIQHGPSPSSAHDRRLPSQWEHPHGMLWINWVNRADRNYGVQCSRIVHCYC